MNDWRDKLCDEWQGSTTSNGYGRRHRGLAHRVAWEDHYGPIPEGMCVLHKCDNPPCREITHLFLGTRQDNTDDKVAKGRQCRGSSRPLAKLHEREVADIKRTYIPRDRNFGTRALSRYYGVSQSAISSIVRGDGWRHVV